MQTQSETQLFPDLKIAQLSDGNDTTGSTGSSACQLCILGLGSVSTENSNTVIIPYKVFLNSQASFK